MLEQAIKFLVERKALYESTALSQPPTSMEDLKYRVGQYNECCALLHEIERIAKGIEDEV